MKLKFTIKYFRELDAPGNLINLWNYSLITDHFPCLACRTYSGFCKTVLKGKWSPEWGDFDFVIEKIKNCDKNFIDISNFSCATRHKIINILIQKSKDKLFNCKLVF